MSSKDFRGLPCLFLFHKFAVGDDYSEFTNLRASIFGLAAFGLGSFCVSCFGTL